LKVATSSSPVAGLLLVFEFMIKLGADSATLARPTEQCDGAKPFR
jgi:hypothetical protein